MVKLNDFIIPLVIGAVLSVVLSKKKTSFALPVVNPYYTNIATAQAAAIQKLDTNIETLQSVKESNLGIAKSILDYEKNLSDLDISKIQNELGKTQSFISQQQKIQPANLSGNVAHLLKPNKIGGANWTAQNLLAKFNSMINYNARVGLPFGASIFPDLHIGGESGSMIQAAARYEKAQENIQAASQLVLRQHGEIDRLQDEYQTRFGSLSRYG